MLVRGRPRKIRLKKRAHRQVLGKSGRAGARDPMQIMAALGRSRVRPRR